MSLHANITAIIGETNVLHVDDFYLNEKVGEHASFSFKVRGDYLENNSSETSILNSSKEFLGRNCSLQIEDVEDRGNNVLYFKGIITNVEGRKGDDEKGLADYIVITGKSASFILDNFSLMNSYNGQTLGDIIDRVLSQYDRAALEVDISPEDDKNLFYSVQNGQSAFGYLQYLAATNGEYLLYNSQTLYFGKPNLGEPINLRYGYDLEDFKLGLETQSLKFEYSNNDYYSDSQTTASSSSGSSGSGYSAFASRISQQVQVETSQFFFPTYEDAHMQERLDKAVQLQKKVKEQSQVTLQGLSTNTGVTLGKLINVKSESDSFGEFRITKVLHHCDKHGKYTNTFVAVPTEIDIYPLTNIGWTNKSELQIATVMDTNDPEGMSRITVQFPWQKAESKTTPWLRVATLYAGGDRGLHFIPEIGDQVIIAFENGNVERPFVQSSLYTNTNKHSHWQSDKNNFKGITTKSGHSIELRDTEGGEMITISDKNSNIIQLDTNGSSIVISAPENLILQAKNIDIRATENIRVAAGKNKINQIGGNYMLEATNIFESASAEIKSKADAIVNQAAADISISSASGNVNKQAGGKINNNSGEQGNLF